MNSQEAKFDNGKPQCRLVPSEIVRCIARIREYGCRKYHDPENWKRVEASRYDDAMYRHLLAYIDNPLSVDEESGLPHLWHIACNAAFLCELRKPEIDIMGVKKMKCKFCKTRLQVTNCREYNGKIYRSRFCPNCESNYYTEEIECERKDYLAAVNYEKKMRDLAKLDKKSNI